ncbi:MAG: type II toxin-antitoxin system PemK/MazF family toxin [Persephonella sp.]|nr:MAG: type II toxin-antitoxin system PemK/MazF family toxin [Persephonella sp.]
MERFIKGDVVVVPFPFYDLSQYKKRPALVITNLEGEDLILCQITSKYKKDKYSINLNQSDFIEGNLKIDSFIRPNKIFTVHKDLILYKVGHIKEEKMYKVLEKIKEIIINGGD